MNYLQSQRNRIGAAIERRIGCVMSHGQFIMGPEVYELEERLAEYAGVKHCITCASGTDAVEMAVRAIGKRYVSLPALTFVATIEAVRNSSCYPKHNDVDPYTWCSNCDISVELFGNPSDGSLIGDCAQSFGAEIDDVKSISKYQIGCTSFFPTKPLGCYGDGGACFTDDDDYAAFMRSYRCHGQGKDKYDNVRVGRNSRLDTIQAAVLLEKLNIFDDELYMRKCVAGKYLEYLSGGPVVCQHVYEENESAWALFCVLARDSKHRARVMGDLHAAGYDSRIYYPTPLHQQPAYETGQSLPIAENICSRIFSLPFHPYIELEDIEKVCDLVWKN